MVDVRISFITLTFGLALGCNTFDGDVTEVDLSFQQCVYLCDNTEGCISISYKQKTTLCKMHFINTTAPLDCYGYVYLKKSDWRVDTFVQRYTGLKRCEQFRTCLNPVQRCTPRHPSQGVLLGNRFSQGHMITLLCKPGYVVNGRRPKTCQDGNWLPEVPYCEKDPDCMHYLVDGPNGVEDEQLTESSNWCEVIGDSVCNPGDTSATCARLNSKGLRTGGWIAGVNTSTEYIQVDFLTAKTISTIVLQGRDPASYFTAIAYNYVTKFKTLLSKDCNTFYEVNGMNKNKIFPGTTGPDSIVVRPLLIRQLARCVRIHPTEWVEYAALRFDIQGC